MSSSTHDVDAQIEVLRRGEKLTEEQVKVLCERAKEILAKVKSFTLLLTLPTSFFPLHFGALGHDALDNFPFQPLHA
jgi:hypothetical protein